MRKTLSSFLGLRTLKTVIAVVLAAMLMKYVFHQSMFFACIGAVVAVEKTVSSSLRAAVIRNIGTLIGGLVGIGIASFTGNILIISLGLIPIIYIHNAANKRESIVPAAIVYFAVAYLNTMENAWVYGLSRIFGTFVGTVVGLAVNFLIFRPPLESDPAETQSENLAIMEIS